MPAKKQPSGYLTFAKHYDSQKLSETQLLKAAIHFSRKMLN